jgi:hypothetical protein
MNAARLREIVDLLLNLEAEFRIQPKLSDANSHLSNIVQQPQQAQFQTQFSNDVRELREVAAQIQQRLQPAQISLIDEIGGKRFFVDDLAAEIDEWGASECRHSDHRAAINSRTPNTAAELFRSNHSAPRVTGGSAHRGDKT